MAAYFTIEIGDNPDLAKIAQIVEIRKGRAELLAFLKKSFAELEPDELLRWLFLNRWKAIFTTNYDCGIQRCYEVNPDPLQNPVTITKTSELVSCDFRFQIPIYHLHGCLFGSSQSDIIITEDDYAKFRTNRKMMFELLKNEFATSTILYIGYSNRDPNWKVILDEIRAEFLPYPTPPSYRIAPTTDPLDIEILKAKGIETLEFTLEDFRKITVSSLSAGRISSDLLQRIGKEIPSELAPSFDKNPAAVIRLLSSWDFVNQAPFNLSPNVSDYLRGDRPNWALVGKRLFFERDIEEQVYDDLLDYATTSSKVPRLIIVLGSAGYGTSTLLMALSAGLVKDNAGPVFMHKPGTPLLEGDIEFLTTIFPNQRPFLVIDNASDSASILHTIIHRFRDTKKSALFLLGERLNEWLVRHGRLSGKEYLLEPLSDPEINRLIDFLAAEGELGVLKDLDRKHQFSVIKTKHLQELLVAMREATEGKGFDAIIEDEYRSIPNEKSRRLYLIVSCFYQHGNYIRDQLLADLLKMSLPDMYNETKDDTEGVVRYELIDTAYGHYAARTRHRTIAEIVWERCGDRGEHSDILQASMYALNFQYKADRDVFETLIRSDKLVASIRSLEGKISLFERACKKDPDNPYVRQHYARMLYREEKLELSLGQIEEALKINSKIRVLYHTKGVILSQLAKTIMSQELARRRLVQSEEAFRHCLSFYDRDEYAYQGIAQLYLDWARRAKDPTESTEYISKAETVITEGLQRVRERDGLWIISAGIQRWIGNQPSQLRALEQAVQSSPGSIVGRYLLGRAYRKSGLPQKALEVLEPIIQNHQNEFRSFVEYAHSMLEAGQAPEKAIAILQISTLYGLSDPRFIATLGGLLFITRNFTDAKKIFEESYKKEFPAIEANKIQFRPNDPQLKNTPLRLSGKVVTVKAGYAFIEVPGFENFFCPGSKFGGLILVPGLNLSFEPAFSARGAIADNLKCI
ncbi:MAG: SIR2 family protein [Deltaproteobacteria bacterium]|nr:SIR2 family protein [Deltaproteobacteria bacterium]